jgi:Tfp pilus assembly protein PilF
MARKERIVGWGSAFVLLAAAAGASQVAEEQNRKESRDHYQIGQAHMRSEEWDKAEAEFKESIKLDPLFTLAHYSLGQVYMNTRAYPQAVRAFTGCKEAFKQAAALGSVDKGVAEHQLDQDIRDLRDTINAYTSGAVKSNQPNNMVLRLESRIAELERMRRRGSVSTDMPAEFSLALGSAHLRNGQLAEAEREYQEAVKVNPKMGEAYNNLAVVYMSTGRLAEAENAVKQAEKAGFKVHPQLKKDIASKKG